MVPKYFAATSCMSATFPTALDSWPVIALLIFDSRSFPSLKILGTENFGEDIRGGRALTIIRELGDELEELDEMRPP
jgi:hypothetical protein